MCSVRPERKVLDGMIQKRASAISITLIIITAICFGGMASGSFVWANVKVMAAPLAGADDETGVKP
jgi:hypothetical protein